MRTFDTGATRDDDAGKLDYEGFLSPIVLQRYAEYMHRHRQQADGKLRDSDNWQKGIPIKQYLKSLWRHFTDVWLLVRGYRCSVTLEDALCAVLFNAMGMLHEVIKRRLVPTCQECIRFDNGKGMQPLPCFHRDPDTKTDAFKCFTPKRAE